MSAQVEWNPQFEHSEWSGGIGVRQFEQFIISGLRISKLTSFGCGTRSESWFLDVLAIVTVKLVPGWGVAG